MNKSFSLLELLVVTTIISILSALFLSSVAKARIKAQKVACRVAVRSYSMRFSENGGRLVVEIPQEANCHQCHIPRYNVVPVLDDINNEP